MNNINIYKNAKAGRVIRESYDELLGMWGIDIKEQDICFRIDLRANRLMTGTILLHCCAIFIRIRLQQVLQKM